MVIYLTRVMGEDSGFAAVQVNLFEGTCYLSPLLGAWLADSLWGRYRTILVFSVIYFLVRTHARARARAAGRAAGPRAVDPPTHPPSRRRPCLRSAPPPNRCRAW
jgi:hypothetical protein